MEVWVNTHNPNKKSSQHLIPQGTTNRSLFSAVLKGEQKPEDYKVYHRGVVTNYAQRIWPDTLCKKGGTIDIAPQAMKIDGGASSSDEENSARDPSTCNRRKQPTRTMNRTPGDVAQDKNHKKAKGTPPRL